MFGASYYFPNTSPTKGKVAIMVKRIYLVKC